jgi:hypothetical protein
MNRHQSATKGKPARRDFRGKWWADRTCHPPIRLRREARFSAIPFPHRDGKAPANPLTRYGRSPYFPAMSDKTKRLRDDAHIRAKTKFCCAGGMPPGMME